MKKLITTKIKIELMELMDLIKSVRLHTTAAPRFLFKKKFQF